KTITKSYALPYNMKSIDKVRRYADIISENYELLNLDVGWTLPNSPATFYFRAENLLDKKYFNVG
ncbi:MAG: hypothetical protein QGG64_25115, partial [Candidatus Latescibacteria bacterium]|nr:hypothetical protein [Candidatus Latescibacterota bacterium]